MCCCLRACVCARVCTQAPTHILVIPKQREGLTQVSPPPSLSLSLSFSLSLSLSFSRSCSLYHSRTRSRSLARSLPPSLSLFLSCPSVVAGQVCVCVRACVRACVCVCSGARAQLRYATTTRACFPTAKIFKFRLKRLKSGYMSKPRLKYFRAQLRYATEDHEGLLGHMLAVVAKASTAQRTYTHKHARTHARTHAPIPEPTLAVG